MQDHHQHASLSVYHHNHGHYLPPAPITATTVVNVYKLMGHGTYHHHLSKHYHQYLLNYLLLPLYPITNTYYYNTYHDHRQLLLPPAQLTTTTSTYHYLLSRPRLTPTANNHQEYQHQHLLLPVTTTYDCHLLSSPPTSAGTFGRW